MVSRKFTNESLLYLLAFALALIMRLIHLGQIPLTDSESVLALQALAIARGEPALLAAQPGYVLLTSLLFFLMGSTEFLARFWPAICGALVVAAPYFFKDLLGRRAAVILAFALAIDPGLVALSRQAGSPMIGVGFTLLAVGAWMTGRTSLAGVLTGLALLGGPQLWPGWLSLAGAVLAGFLFFPSGLQEIIHERRDLATLSPDGRDKLQSPLGKFARSILITLLLAGTLFFWVPNGLSGLAASLPAYLQSFTNPAGLPIISWLAVLLIYLPFPLIFGLWGAVRGWRHGLGLDQFFAAWLLAALFLALVNPSRQPTDAVWVIIPLWSLAARQLARLTQTSGLVEDKFPLFAQALLVVIAFVFIGFNLARLPITLQENPQNSLIVWFIIVGAFLLLLLTSYLIAWGWSFKASGFGLLFGSLVVLTVYSLAASTAVIRRPDEVWSPGPAVEQADLLLTSIEDLSLWNTGRREATEVVVTEVESPALVWNLREFDQVRFINRVPSGSMPALVITPHEQQPSLAASYRGQDFVWRRGPDWSGMSLNDWLIWWLYRTSPEQREDIILWARADIFPDRTAPPGLNSVP